MKHIEESNIAIDNAGGDHSLAKKLEARTNISEKKLYSRIRMWRINGVPLPFVRVVAKLGNIGMNRLIP